MKRTAPSQKTKLDPPGWPLLANGNEPSTVSDWPKLMFSNVPAWLARAQPLPVAPSGAGPELARQAVAGRPRRAADVVGGEEHREVRQRAGPVRLHAPRIRRPRRIARQRVLRHEQRVRGPVDEVGGRGRDVPGLVAGVRARGTSPRASCRRPGRRCQVPPGAVHRKTSPLADWPSTRLPDQPTGTACQRAKPPLTT